VLANSQGKVARDEELKDALKLYFALNGKVSGDTRHTLIRGDIAFLILDWVIDYTDENGNLGNTQAPQQM